MVRYTHRLLFIKKVFQVTKPPISGYELVELPNEKVLKEFMQYFIKKAILVIVHSGEINSGEVCANLSKLNTNKEGSLSGTTTLNNELRQKNKPYSALQDPLTSTFIASLNTVNLGNPDELKLVLVPGPNAPNIVTKYCILGYPTTLLFVEGSRVMRLPCLHDFSRPEAGISTKPSWNMTTKDEAHPFPEHAYMHTNTRYNGVEVVSTHFPATIKGTTYLRLPNSSKPKQWEINKTKVRSLNRHRYQCPALEFVEPPMSYLATLVVQDNAVENKEKENRWCASVALEGTHANRFIRPKMEQNYLRLNKNKNILKTSTYLSPMRRVEEETKLMRCKKRLQEEASQFTPNSLYVCPDGPRVFKMSNMDQWWKLCPVKVAKDQAALRTMLMKNSFSFLSTATQN